MSPEKGKVPITPEEVLLNAFAYAGTSTLELQELIEVALQANCPNADVAQGVLLNMVEKGLLTWKKQGNKVYFTIVQATPRNTFN